MEERPPRLRNTGLNIRHAHDIIHFVLVVSWQSHGTGPLQVVMAQNRRNEQACKQPSKILFIKRKRPNLPICRYHHSCTKH